jgi:hypothetical protein
MNFLDLYSTADLMLARVARFLPNPLVRWVQRQISRQVLKRIAVPPAWLAKGPDGFQPEDEMDLVFGYGSPNPERVGCCSEVELIELATRRRPMGDPGYKHIAYCSPCYRRGRVLQRLKVG